MAGLTRSSRRERNGRARASVLTGFLAVAVLPGAVALAEMREEIELLDASGAIPVAAALGLLAVVLARRARQQVERTLGRVGGAATAAIGRVLGVLGICLATSGAIAIGTYYALSRWAE